MINDFFTRVSEDRLLNEPGMQPLRKELLQDVLPYYRRFLIEFADDPTIRDELALTHFRIGLITEEIDGHRRCTSLVRNAPAECRKRCWRSGLSDGECLRDLGNTLTAIGRVLQRQSRHDEARVLSAGDRDPPTTVQSQPGDHEAQRMLANSYMNLGLLEKDVGNVQEALGPYEQAQEIRQRILQTIPTTR